MRRSLSAGFLFFGFFSLLAFFLFSVTSCSTAKKVKYFANIPDSGQLKIIPAATYLDPKIQGDDILTIIVSTTDINATQIINLGNVAVSGLSPSSSLGSSNPPVVSGYLVSKDGNVELPILGKINLLGLSTGEAAEVIRKRAESFYKDPSVIVRYANFKITVTGEVARPSVYVMPSEKVTILDALSIAGDLTIYGKRDNILLLRDNADGSKTPYRIDITNTRLIDQPYYYLRQNDYIYVEPSKSKVAANDIQQTRNITILSSIVTVLIVIISKINFN